MTSRNQRLGAILASLLVPGLAIAAATAHVGCTQLECAEGTIESDGECVADVVVDDTQCGEGTVLGDDGKCEPEIPPTYCDPDTTIEIVDPDTGEITCQGTGSSGCNSPIACPSPTDDSLTVCGRIFNVEDQTPVLPAAVDPASLGAQCGTPEANTETGSACNLSLTFVDALPFASNPTTAPLLVPQDLYVDDCGRFRATGVPAPQSGFLGLGIDDEGEIREIDASGTYRLTGVAAEVDEGSIVRMEGFVVTETLNQDWSDDVGLATSFVDQGVFMSIFRENVANPATAVAGVTVTRSGSPQAGSDYYFEDTDPLLRTEVTDTGPTGANGTALIVGSSLVPHSGTGGEPEGCIWSSNLASSIPGVLFISQRFPECN